MHMSLVFETFFFFFLSKNCVTFKIKYYEIREYWTSIFSYFMQHAYTAQRFRPIFASNQIWIQRDVYVRSARPFRTPVFNFNKFNLKKFYKYKLNKLIKKKKKARPIARTLRAELKSVFKILTTSIGLVDGKCRVCVGLIKEIFSRIP